MPQIDQSVLHQRAWQPRVLTVPCRVPNSRKINFEPFVMDIETRSMGAGGRRERYQEGEVEE